MDLSRNPSSALSRENTTHTKKKKLKTQSFIDFVLAIGSASR
jgi:hypothetical protein